MATVLPYVISLLRVALVVALLFGIRRWNASLLVNALVALGATFLPALVEVSLATSYGVRTSVDELVTFWIASAGFLHTVGMLGWYESKWWWDHVTHLVSAAFVAAAFYGCVHGIAIASTGRQPSTAFAVGLTLAFTLSVGVFWELVELVVHRYSRELGVESVLIPYGRRDTALDLVFDAVGALLVVGLDVRIFDSVAATVPTATTWLLLSAGGFVIVGSFGSVLALLLWDVRFGAATR